MLEKIKKQIEQVQEIPSIIVGLFFVSVVSMNLLANKTIVNLPYLALDGGIVFGWLSFLCMDLVTIYCGLKASNMLSITAVGVNILVAILFKIVSIIPTSDNYDVFNSIFGGTWFVLLGSTIAMILSFLINNFINWWIGRFFDGKVSKLEYVCRTYSSTFIGQFFDNLIFSVIVFMFFSPIYWNGFSWTFIQCLTCSLTGAFFELLFQVIFSPIGYKISTSWVRKN